MTISHWFTGLLMAFSFTTTAVPESGLVDLLYPRSTVVAKNFHVNLSADILYQNMDLKQTGISQDAVKYAVEGYNKLLNEDRVPNSRYLTIIDFSKALNQKRFFLLDLQNQEVVLSTYVMHGKNSGKEDAVRFSNKVNSYKSSLGFYLTSETYKGMRGYSLRLDGLEKGFNSNARRRAIVLHGSNYINDTRVKRGKIGRSEGCPAIPMQQSPGVIDKVKDGSVLFIYHPNKNYLENSPVLNS